MTEVVTCAYTFTDDEKFFAYERGKCLVDGRHQNLAPMCEAQACELSRGGNAFGPMTLARPRKIDSSKLPISGGGIGGYDAHALPGRCLPVMFLLSTMSKT